MYYRYRYVKRYHRLYSKYTTRSNEIKLAKATARYMEMEEFKDSDHHTGYFCYNCIYFMKPNHCAIVTDEGPDVYGKTSGEIASYGICSLWEPNKEEMR